MSPELKGLACVRQTYVPTRQEGQYRSDCVQQTALKNLSIQE